jgi:3-methylcrotonyl-CoA carboxylase alpha subunit
MGAMTPIRKLLIANRGEIACRIMATARRMGIATVAVYSDADASARHVALADEAVRLGPAPAPESYLRIDRVLDAARTTGADAIHPGYGFLAESAAFARACAEAGVTYVGPPADVIERLGLKGAAKDAAIAAGVPVLPGYQGIAQDDATLVREATRIGFPLAVKAAAGGGGRGLRLVERAADLMGAIDSARREARGAFGDDRLILERWVTRPRHVEVQIVADRHGTVLHLHKRDCSVQRRHQKVVEEAPAPGLSDDLRGRVTGAAVALARAAGYVNAGTVEFLVDRDAFFFLEVNTRLQVEHPITECITGFDLVELQLRVASGEPLGIGQGDVPAHGHAFEVRVCAEDPARDFLPQAGRLDAMHWPDADTGARVDTGFGTGDVIGRDYDSLLGKLIVHGRDREDARRAMVAALGRCAIAGLATNIDFLAAVMAHPEFAAGAPDTGFLGRTMADLVPRQSAASAAVVAAAALAVVLGRKIDDCSPWAMGRPWRLNAPAMETVRLRDGTAERVVAVTHRADGFALTIDGVDHRASASLGADGVLTLTLDGMRRVARVARSGASVTVMGLGAARRLTVVDPLGGAESASETPDGHLRAPMPGKVVKVHVRPGDAVERGAPLIALEAMKMEHTIAAPSAGRVATVPFAVGDLVGEGDELIVLEAEAG